MKRRLRAVTITVSQANFIEMRSYQSVVFANINEHVLTTTDNPLDAWDELFQVGPTL